MNHIRKSNRIRRRYSAELNRSRYGTREAAGTVASASARFGSASAPWRSARRSMSVTMAEASPTRPWLTSQRGDSGSLDSSATEMKASTAQWPWRGRCGEDEAEPDAQDRTDSGHHEDDCRVLSPGMTRCHLVDVGVDDGQDRADADTGDDPCDVEVEVVRGKGVVQRPDTGDQHGDQEHVASSEAVRQRAEPERADDVSGQVQHHR